MNIIFCQAILFAILVGVSILFFVITEKDWFSSKSEIWDTLFSISIRLLLLYCAGIAYYWILHPFVKKGILWIVSMIT